MSNPTYDFVDPRQLLSDALTEAVKGSGGLACRVHEAQVAELQKRIDSLSYSHDALSKSNEAYYQRFIEAEERHRAELKEAGDRYRLSVQEARAAMADAEKWRKRLARSEGRKLSREQHMARRAQFRGGTAGDFWRESAQRNFVRQLKDAVDCLIEDHGYTDDQVRAHVEAELKRSRGLMRAAAVCRQDELRAALCAPAPKSCLEVIAEAEAAAAPK